MQHELTSNQLKTKDNQYRNKLIENLRNQVLERVDPAEALELTPDQLKRQIFQLISEISEEQRIGINFQEQGAIAHELLNDIIGLGPLEALLADTEINDILVNGHQQVYVERQGQLSLSDCQFRSPEHLLNVARRIVSRIGRRIDESNPMVDARLADGSRVNIITAPLSRSGTCISIRKFPEQRINLDGMVANNCLSTDMAAFLKLAVAARLNIIVSGGTGSGKTTMLNGLSRSIHAQERVITIEDAAELQLQQSHVISLETRAKSIENTGQVTQRELVKNALRMRPDRIILGEVRGEEIFDMMQAMNTGHDGSMSTIHANSTNDALVRMESMFNMGSMDLSAQLIRKQIARSVDLIVQVERALSGQRRVIDIAEVFESNDGNIETRSIFKFVNDQHSQHQLLCLPHCTEKFTQSGLSDALNEVFKDKTELVSNSNNTEQISA